MASTYNLLEPGIYFDLFHRFSVYLFLKKRGILESIVHGTVLNLVLSSVLKVYRFALYIGVAFVITSSNIVRDTSR